ncbi:MAG: cytidylate kinase-like family protein [Lachnospiraceae bacterium]|nr:cytidylate kinase-like family protein [Lachnospiraceae bacterium]
MAGRDIITIGRQFGSGGHEVGRRLAAELGLTLYDKELLKMVAQESNICEQVLEDYDEKPTGSLLYSIVMDIYPSMNYVGNTLHQQIYQAQYDTIMKLGQKGGCVIVGRAADYILRDNPRLTSVFVHAKDDFRAQRIMEYEHISKDKALDMIARADKKRASFYNFQTEKKWGQAASYNLTVDTSALGIDGCVTLIRRYLELKNR